MSLSLRAKLHPIEAGLRECARDVSLAYMVGFLQNPGLKGCQLSRVSVQQLWLKSHDDALLIDQTEGFCGPDQRGHVADAELLPPDAFTISMGV